MAALHADSWRRHYRGAYADTYLDGDLVDDRRQVWAQRLRDTTGTSATILAVSGVELAGFAHVILDADSEWGALLDNLHVAVAHQRRGIGAALMARAGEFVTRRRPGAGLFLWVLEQNISAQDFYAAIGGRPAGTQAVRPVNGVPGRLAGEPVGIRYVWPEPDRLPSGNER